MWGNMRGLFCLDVNAIATHKFAIKPTEVVVGFEVLFYIKVTATQSYLIFQVVNFFKGNTDNLKRQNG